MSKRNVNYVQCTMKRHCNGAIVQTTSYIPQRFATVGRKLKLKNDQGIWIDGWIVMWVSDHVVTSDDLPDSHKAIKNHRKLSGDSWPRI